MPRLHGSLNLNLCLPDLLQHRREHCFSVWDGVCIPHDAQARLQLLGGVHMLRAVNFDCSDSDLASVPTCARSCSKHEHVIVGSTVHAQSGNSATVLMLGGKGLCQPTPR